MFKNLLLSFLLLSSCAAMASTDPAVKYDVGGLRYALDGNKAIVWPLSDDFTVAYEGDVVVPEKVTIDGKEYPVVGVSRRAFSDCDELTSVVLPQSIEWLSEGCFACSPKLSSISFAGGKTGNGVYEVRNGIVYTVPTESSFTLDLTNEDRPYAFTSGAAPLHYPQYKGHVSIDADGNEANDATYFMWYDGDNVEHKVLRFYRGSTFTITSQSAAITKIEFFFDGIHEIEAYEGQLSDDGTTWTGRNYAVSFGSLRRNSLDSVRVTLEGTTAQAFAAPIAHAITTIDPVCALAREAFTNNSAESITIPASVDFVGYNSLSIRGLKELHMQAAPPKYKDNPFVSTDKTSCRLYVPEQYVDAYKTDSLWGRFRLVEAELPSGIKAVSRQATVKASAYNLAGQAVDDHFHGIVISEGKKVIR